MKLITGSKRLDLVREVFYWTLFALCWDKLDKTGFVTITIGIVGGYLTARTIGDKGVTTEQVDLKNTIQNKGN